MPYFKTPDNKPYFLTDEDIAKGWVETLPAGSVQCTDEEAEQLRQALLPKPTQADLIRQQIVELEVKQSDRRIREAVLGIDGGWLANLNGQIESLRAQLQVLTQE